MKIIVAQNVGFCWGVERAIDITFKALEGDNRPNLYSLGKVIHNPQMTEKLSELGLLIVNDVKEIVQPADNSRKHGFNPAFSAEADKTRLLVRSHGISPDLIGELSSQAVEIIDATCPFVKRTQRLVRELKEEGYKIIIVGERQHPEVKGLMGYAGGEVTVVNTVSELSNYKFDKNRRWAVTAQSTQSQKNFKEIVAKLIEKNLYELRILFSICQETLKRESLTCDLAKRCDLMLIVGGFDSANTRRLKEIAGCFKDRSYQVENAEQVNPAWFEGISSVGIVSGTSTPKWVVDEVVKKINPVTKLTPLDDIKR